MTMNGLIARAVAAASATWPPATRHPCGAFLVGEGRGGGQRVSTAVLHSDAGAVSALDIEKAAALMLSLGQKPAFQIIGDGCQDALDDMLATMGYGRGDHVMLMVKAVGAIDADEAVTAHWPPTEAQRTLWAACGIGPARLDVMARAPDPRTTLALMQGSATVGTAFVAVSDGIAVVHAVDIAPAMRRQGFGRRLMHAAAHWAHVQGATHLALLVVSDNAPARALYDGLGFVPLTTMHYRVAGECA